MLQLAESPLAKASEARRYTVDVAQLFASDGGLVPPSLARHSGGSFLDIHCGAGWWSHQIAKRFPSCSVVGVDSRASLIDVAQETRQANVTFILAEQLDQRLSFPSSSVAFLHLNYASQMLLRENWQVFLKECFRVLQADGVIFLQERDCYSLSNHRAFTDYNDLLVHALRLSGHLLQQWTEERCIGPVELLSGWLENSGFENIQGEEVQISCAPGAPAYQEYSDLLVDEMALFRPVLVQLGLGTTEQIRHLETHAREAMCAPDFAGFLCFQQVWATKTREKEREHGPASA